MTAKKAIEILGINLYHPYVKELPDLQEAMKLSSEALKAWQFLRSHSGFSAQALLPGETKD